MKSSAVAILALGVVNPSATGLKAFEAVLRSGKRRIDAVDPAAAPRGKSLMGRVNEQAIAPRFRAFHLAGMATQEALGQWDPRRAFATADIAFFLSSIGGESAQLEKQVLAQGGFDDPPEGPGGRRAHWRAACGSVPNGRLQMKLARRFGFGGPQIAISNACASGNVSIGVALDMIRDGECKVAVISAVELCTIGTLWGADRAAILGTRLSPFDAARDGAIFGEGAATVILADPSVVEAANVLGWVCGFGSSCDAENAAIAFASSGTGLYRAMAAAADDAELRLSTLDYVNAHSPGTPVIDKLECKAVADLLGGSTSHVAINSTKSITTHLAGAGSITEVAATVLQMNSGFVHGNVGLENVAPDMAMAPVGPSAVDRRVQTALSNALGGGGLYTTVALRHAGWRPQDTAVRVASARGALVVAGAAWHRSAATQADAAVLFPVLKEFAHMNRAGQLALAISSRILAQARQGLDPLSGVSTPWLGVFAGTFLGGLPESLLLFLDLLSKNPKAIKPSTVLEHGVNLGGALIGRQYGLTGPNYSFVGSRNSAIQALAGGLSHLSAGRIQAALVAGFDSVHGLLEAPRVHASFEATSRMVDAAAGVLLKSPKNLSADDRVLGKIASAAVVRKHTLERAVEPALRRLGKQLRCPSSGISAIRLRSHSQAMNAEAILHACWHVWGDVRAEADDCLDGDVLSAWPLMAVEKACATGGLTLVIQADEYGQLGGVLVEGTEGVDGAGH